LGAAGKDAEIAASIRLLGHEGHCGSAGRGAGPTCHLKNVYKLATDKAKKLGVKAPEEYYTDPNSEEGQAAIQAMANRWRALCSRTARSAVQAGGQMQAGPARWPPRRKSMMQELKYQIDKELAEAGALAGRTLREQLKLAPKVPAPWRVSGQYVERPKNATTGK
jgi:hypothetical protein